MRHMTNSVEIEMFLDVSCPWCHGGLETNQRVLAEFAADPTLPHLRVTWRFMRLHPMAREGMSLDDMYASFMGDDPAAWEQAREGVREYVASVGARVDFANYTFVHDPFTAHRLLAIVRDDAGNDLPGLWSLARVVWAANFVDGIDITDPAALRTAVEAGGLQLPQRVWDVLADEDGHSEATRADHARALEVQLDGVPRMVVGGQIVPTWVDPAVVRSTLRAAIEAAALSLA